MVEVKGRRIVRRRGKEGDNTVEQRRGAGSMFIEREREWRSEKERGEKGECCRRASTRVNVRTNAPRIGFGVVSMETNSLGPGNLPPPPSLPPPQLSCKIALRPNSKKFEPFDTCIFALISSSLALPFACLPPPLGPPSLPRRRLIPRERKYLTRQIGKQ